MASRSGRARSPRFGWKQNRRTPFSLRSCSRSPIGPRSAPASTALSKEFEGLWEGVLEAGGQQLRLQVKLRNVSGTGSGTVVTIDQGNVEIPITSVSQNQRQLEFTVRAVNGSYAGTLSPDGSTLDGKWTQAGNSAPLVLKRAETRCALGGLSRTRISKMCA
jgi:hypothetical protein